MVAWFLLLKNLKNLNTNILHLPSENQCPLMHFFWFSMWKPCPYSHQLLKNPQACFLSSPVMLKFSFQSTKRSAILIIATKCYRLTINRTMDNLQYGIIYFVQSFSNCNVACTPLSFKRRYIGVDVMHEQKLLIRQNRSLLISKCHVVRLRFNEKNPFKSISASLLPIPNLNTAAGLQVYHVGRT